MRAYTKAIPVINKEEYGQTPRFYIRCLAEMEDFINEVWEDRDGRYVLICEYHYFLVVRIIHFW